LQLPEHHLKNLDFMSILDAVHSRRTARSIRRHIAAHRVHLCEDNLRSLREALRHADRDLEEVDSSIGVLQDLFQWYPAEATNSLGDVTSQTLNTFYDSGASDESASTNSDNSEAGWVAGQLLQYYKDNGGV